MAAEFGPEGHVARESVTLVVVLATREILTTEVQVRSVSVGISSLGGERARHGGQCQSEVLGGDRGGLMSD